MTLHNDWKSIGGGGGPGITVINALGYYKMMLKMILRILLTAFQCGKPHFTPPEVFIFWVLVTHCVLHSDCDSVVCCRSQTTKKVMHHSLVADYKNGSGTLSIAVFQSIVEVLPSSDNWSLPGYVDISLSHRNDSDILTITWRF